MAQLISISAEAAFKAHVVPTRATWCSSKMSRRSWTRQVHRCPGFFGWQATRNASLTLTFDFVGAGEFWYDEAAQILYLWHNASSGTPPPSNGSLVSTVSRVLINTTGTMKSPITGLKLLSLGFRDTHETNMDPHAVPSAGDWALPRSAAVFLQGAVDATIDGCVFERLDGNAVMLSAFNRNVTISRNEFAWIGASAVAVWGNAEGGGSVANDSLVPPGFGFDGTNGDQPRGCTITQNLCRENGVIVKQSSFYTSFKGSANTVSGNWVYNGPRAHINVNDGFRGANVIERNLLVNGIRETSDREK
jgi:hypothetical protein